MPMIQVQTEKESPLTAFWEASYFPSLDGLRAICILLVIFNHVHAAYPRFIYGWVGVDIFFVLSGFLITTLLLREREAYGNLSLKGFYTRRAFRILPIYFAVLAGYLVLIPTLHDWERWSQMKHALPYLLTFTQEFRPASAGNVYNQTWSLGYEEKFYLLWPLFILLSFPFRTRKTLLVIAASSLILLLPATPARSYGGLFLGGILGILLDKSSSRPIQNAICRIPWPIALALSVATYLLAGRKPALILLFSLAISIFTATLVAQKGLARRLLEHPAVVLLGKRSYAMYLVHIVVLDGLEVVARRLHLDLWYIVVPAAYMASFVVAMILFRCIERPCVSYGRKLSKRMREQLNKATASIGVLQQQIASGIAVIEREEPDVPRAY